MVGMVGDLFPFEVRPENAFDFAAERVGRTRANSRANAGKARDYIGCRLPQQAAMTIPTQAGSGEPSLTYGAPSAVLDTNVVLDWLLFGEPSVSALTQAVAAGRLRWIATAPMRDELAHVLGRGLAVARCVDAAAILATWDRHATLQPEPPTQRLRVTDPDDQKFVDLALGTRARWLVSRDRAVLKLARRAAQTGTSIVTPEHWTRDTSPRQRR
jgi:predicted nucleic acid-binding protein